MAHEVPLFKLGALLIKTLAKPMSKRVKSEFSRYEFTQEILVGIGQMTHAVTSRLTIWSAGYKVLHITPLERDVALSRGAEFIGESFIFGVAGSALVWEYNKSKERERKIEEERHLQVMEESTKLQMKLNALNERLVALEEVVKSNSDRILYLGKRYVEPVKAKSIPIDDTSLQIQKETKSKVVAAQEHPTSLPITTNVIGNEEEKKKNHCSISLLREKKNSPKAIEE